MRQFSVAMQNLLNTDGITALSTFWLITRKDGTKLGFTDWTADVTVAGTTYEASSGVTKSALQQRVDLAVPNQDISGILISERIRAQDVRAGQYNGAKLECFMAVPTDADFLTYGRIQLPGAFLGELTLNDGLFLFEVRGLSYLLQQTFIEVYVPVCRADFCDDKCKLNVADFSATGTISEVITQNFTIKSIDMSGPALSTPFPAPAGVAPFTFGLVTFTSGDNAGYATEIIYQHVEPNWVFDLYLPTPYPIKVGDAITAVVGCDKTIGRCIQFNNSINYRGEPAIPGLNQLFDVGISSP